MVRTIRVSLLVVAMSLPAVVWAQTGTIAGAVRDATGGVLPGVSVVATSPALIEKVRTATTDGAGQYKIVDLRAGVYTVTFSLTGFSTVKREGVELTAGINANVDAELRVGGLEETITVSGQNALVDVQNSTRHVAMTRTVLDELPTGRQFGNYGVLIPGVVTNQQDVGGASTNVTTTNIMGVHGSNANEMPMIIDGMRYGNVFGVGGGASGPYLVNNGMVEEIAIDTSGATAEAEVSGFVSNVILKQGGNRFTHSWFGSFSNERLESNNIDDELRSRGALVPSGVPKVWDFNVGVGGPIKRDKVWFYASYRNYGLDEAPTGAYYAKDPFATVFRPPVIVNGQIVDSGSADLSRKAINELRNTNYNGRVTWQTSQNTKLSLYGDQMPRCVCANGLSATTTFEASTYFQNPVNGIYQATWNWTVTNKLLVEVGETAKPDVWRFQRRPETHGRDELSGVVDSGTGITSRAYTSRTEQESWNFNGKAGVTYVTGSNSLKVGTQWFHGRRKAFTYTSNDSFLTLRNGVPQTVNQRTTPLIAEEGVRLNLGIFTQDQYTRNRLTLNLGVRFDYLNSYVPEQHRAAVRFIGARDFAAIDDVPKWKDISPRVGMSYDLFGNAKTAIKASFGRYMEAQAAGFPEAVNPMRAAVGTSTTRRWTDANNNVVPDCDLTNLAENGECGAIDNRNFGRAIVPIRYDPEAVNGWGKRGYNWEYMTGVQHQVTSGLSVDVSYHRRSFGNFRVFENVGVQPGDFNEYCITTPADSRLPGGGDQRVCGFYDINPASGKFGVSDIVVTRAKNIGDMSQVFNAVDVAVNLRLPAGILLQGGTSRGRMRTDWCGVASGRPDITAISPYVGVTGAPSGIWAQFSRSAEFCDVDTPFLTQVKLAGVYPLPWGLKTSATFQSIRYPQEFTGAFGGILAARSFTAAEIQPSLGRPLAGGIPSVTLQMVPPNSLFGDRIYQIDWRIARSFTVGKRRIQPQIDVFNLTNDNGVTTLNNTYGVRWQQPTRILQGRVVKIAVQADF